MLLSTELLNALGRDMNRGNIGDDDEKIYTHLKQVCKDFASKIAKRKAIDEALKIIEEGLESEVVGDVFKDAEEVVENTTKKDAMMNALNIIEDGLDGSLIRDIFSTVVIDYDYEAEANIIIEETEEFNLNLFSMRTDSVKEELKNARKFVIDEEVKASNKTTKELADYLNVKHDVIMRKSNACIKELNKTMSKKKIHDEYFIHSTYNNNRYKCFELTKDGIEELAREFLGGDIKLYRKIKKFISEFYKDEVAAEVNVYSSVNEINDYYNKAYDDLIKEAIDIVKYLQYVKLIYKHNDTIRNVLQNYNEYYLGKISVSDFLNPMFIESYRDILNDIITDNISDELIDTVAILNEIKKLNINRPVLHSYLHFNYEDVYEMFYGDNRVNSGQFLIA